VNIFLSWSGGVSKEVANTLRKWLPFMLQSVKPFVSNIDISRGERWSNKLASELEGAQYGIVCVSAFNIHKPWMNFEAGALAHLPQLAPFLFRVDRAMLGHSPLTQFQLTEYFPDSERSKAEMFQLVESLREALPEKERPESELVEANFDVWWEKLKAELDDIPLQSAGETRTAYPWLHTFDDLDIHALRSDCTLVWFITGDVFKYALRPSTKQQIEANLAKSNVVYRYLIPVPDGGDERAAKDELEKMKLEHGGRFDYRCCPRDEFELRAASDYVIVEYGMTESRTQKAFVRIPLADRSQADGDYWFDTQDNAVAGFYNRFGQLWDELDPNPANPHVGSTSLRRSATT
jgi:hypothetical protein